MPRKAKPKTPVVEPEFVPLHDEEVPAPVTPVQPEPVKVEVPKFSFGTAHIICK